MLSSSTKESRSPKNILTSCVSKVEPSSSTSPFLPSTSLPENPLSDDNAQDVDSISSRGKINKQNSATNPPSSSSSVSSERRNNDSLQEIAEGNCLSKGEISDGKINTPKKRFFDLKRTAESATNKISAISPSRFALSLTPKLRRKNAANHKLSQLERQSNLFIRDGSERKQEELTTVNAVMDNGTNAKHQQDSLSAKLGNNSDTKCKKSSLIPSFHFKIPSTSAANKNSNKTGTNLEILCRNFSPNLKLKQKLPQNSSDANYEEIDFTNEDDENKVDDEDLITIAPDVDKEKSNCATKEESSSTVSSSTVDTISARTMEKKFENFQPNDDEQEEFNTIESWVNGGGEPSDMLSKPEFSSNQFKNIPVRPRKGQVPHMENYCLFDPSVDFCNEKEMRKKNFPTAGFNFPPQTFRNIQVNGIKVSDAANEQQTVYDVSEHDERKHILAHHNYYEIDPELLEQDEAAAAENSRKSIITETSSSSSSCDYPSLNNSVIETTPSSTVTIESTDDNETNPCGKLNNDESEALDVNVQASNAINHENNHDCDENIITVSSVVTAAATGTKKKSPQFDRIVKQTARNLPLSTTDNGNQRQTSSTMKGKSTKINLPCHNKTLSFDPLKASHSLPQLQNITVRQQQQIADGDYNIEINNRTTIQLRRNVRKLRPMSSESLDSGFTTPSPPNEATSSTLTQSQNIPSVAVDNQVDNLNSNTKQPTKNESTVLTQCDNIQQLIEVSNEVKLFLHKHE